MQPYIIYNGVSSEEILEQKLILCSFDHAEEVVVFEKTLQKGAVTKERNVGSDMGSLFSENLEYNLALVKEDNSCFTPDEIETVSDVFCTDYNCKLQLFSDTYDGKFYYNGNFTKVVAKRFNGMNGLVCYFTNDSAFMYIDKSYESIVSLGDIRNMNLNCDSKYPLSYLATTITLTEISPNVTSPIHFKVTNTTDNNQFFTLNLEEGKPVYIESDKYIVKYNNEDKYIGDVFYNNEIYWLSLKKGLNTLSFSHNLADLGITFTSAQITVRVDFTEKRTRGVQDEFN